MHSNLPPPTKVRVRKKTVSEKTIETTVCQYARSNGILTYKFTSPNRRSVPDRLFLGPGGLIFFVEFKAPGKKPTESQAREIRRLREIGHIVEVIDNLLAGQRLIDGLLE